MKNNTVRRHKGQRRKKSYQITYPIHKYYANEMGKVFPLPYRFTCFLTLQVGWDFLYKEMFWTMRV